MHKSQGFFLKLMYFEYISLPTGQNFLLIERIFNLKNDEQPYIMEKKGKEYLQKKTEATSAAIKSKGGTENEKSY